MSHPLPLSQPVDPALPEAPLPEAAVRLVRLSRALARAAFAVLLAALCVLVVVLTVTSRYVEATVTAVAVGCVLVATTTARRSKV